MYRSSFMSQLTCMHCPLVNQLCMSAMYAISAAAQDLLYCLRLCMPIPWFRLACAYSSSLRLDSSLCWFHILWCPCCSRYSVKLSWIHWSFAAAAWLALYGIMVCVYLCSLLVPSGWRLRRWLFVNLIAKSICVIWVNCRASRMRRVSCGIVWLVVLVSGFLWCLFSFSPCSLSVFLSLLLLLSGSRLHFDLVSTSIFQRFSVLCYDDLSL